jgi:cell filamentation protein
VSENADPYVYPGTRVLRNRLGITDGAALDQVERRFVVQRSREGIPDGAFDLVHLQAIHRHLFQDIYDWAGEIRTVEISKGTQQFQLRQFIHTGMADVHRRLVRAGFLTGLSKSDFAQQVAVIIGDINYIHPFREGNGRSQLHYLRALSERAGHKIGLANLDSARWVEASQISHAADYTLLAQLIEAAVSD